MRYLLVTLCCLFVGSLVGCGGPDNQVEVKVEGGSTPTEMLKKDLEQLAVSGQRPGSNIGQLQTYIRKAAEGDQAKIDMLINMTEDLTKLSKPEEIKAKAKEIIGKL